ncbi:PAS domain-containing protein [Hymenobacter rigui]|uniref:histidine kinase n=1 Tax=Hymenobacter rigui TaxID=334424 RepID=A0A428KSR4_9BACT|nr:PAS domain-containing protein [Hymenobacter rigui]RSK49568.1 PAS domain S-box protein [Hymenobacter rigui]
MNFSVPGTSPDEFLPALLDLSVSGVVCYAPILDAAGSVVDFAFAYLNPAAQRLLSLPARPALTYRQVFPEAEPFEAFTFHCAAYASEQPQHFELHYRNGKCGTYCQVNGRRLGELLLVSFTFSEEQDRNEVKQVRRESRPRQQTETLPAEVVVGTQHQPEVRETFYQVFEQTPACIVLLRGSEHRIEYYNEAYQRFFPEHNMLGRTIAEVQPDAVEQGFVSLLDQVFQTGGTFTGRELPLELTQPDGSRQLFYFNFTYQAYREEGRIVGVSVFAYDVTEQVLERELREAEQEKAQRRLQESEQRVRDIVKDAPFPMSVYVGDELRIHLANEAILAAWGKGPDVLGRRFTELMPELANQSIFEELHHVLRTGEVIHRRNQRVEVVIDEVLQPFYFNYTFTPLLDSAGSVYGVLNTATDVTDLILAQQRLEAYATELRESEARFRIMADVAPNQVWAVHPNGAIRYINRAFLDFVGLQSEAEYMATGWLPYLHPDEIDLTQQTLLRAITERAPYVLEHRMRRHDGQYRWLLAQGAPSFLADGELYGYVGSAIDITELKQANEQLTRTNQDLDNFVYAASHDLKQPVNNLAGLFEEIMISSTFTNPEEQEVLVPMVQEALQQLRVTIDDLAALGQAQQLRHAAPEQVVLTELMDEVLTTLEPQVRVAHARITTDFAAWPALSFARVNLRTILLNLVGNSLKYADPARPARIHISTWVERGQPVLLVEDNGLGFDAVRYGTELFHLFRRLHTHTAGTGVGLYLVNRIVEASGGIIEVDSRPGEGATFRIRFGPG